MMKRIITSILWLLVWGNLIAQTNYTALITDPQIGPDANAEKLIEVVDDINKRDSISYVVVMGNITANGKFDEFLWAQEILDGLTAPYFVVGGEKDYYLSEGKGNEITLLWGDDKFWFETEDAIHTGFNVLIPKLNFPIHIEKETIQFVGDKFSTLTDKISFFYTSGDIYSGYMFNKLQFSVHSIFITNAGEEKEKNNATYCGKSLSNSSKWLYEIIHFEKDILSFFSASSLDSNLTIVKQISIDQIPILFKIANGHWEAFFKQNQIKHLTISETIYTEPSTGNNKFYFSTKRGLIVCINDELEEIWTYETTGSIYSSPKVEKDLVVAATNEGDLFTINKNTGNLFQVIGIGETITSDLALVDIEHNGMQTKGICFGTAEGNFYCYELYSLELIWWNNGVKEMINSSVTTVKGKVIFQDKKGTLYCLSSSNGVLLWKWKTKTKIFNPLFKSDLIVSNNNVYFIDFDGDLHCIDALLGTKKWSIRKTKATGKIELNEKKNEIILHSAKNKILTISLDKRKVIEQFVLPEGMEAEIATDIELIGNKLIVGFTNGNVYQLVKKQKPVKILWQGYAPIVSLNKINGNILVTDYDGNLTLLDLSEKKK